MSSFVPVDSNKKDILILSEGPTQELDATTWTAERIYSINFTVTKTRFCLSLHYNGANIIYLLAIQKLINLKQKFLKL